MASTADIKNGLVIHYNNDLYQIVEFLHVKPGKGPAFVRTKLKSIIKGKVVDHTFPSGTKIETARVENRSFQYLYKDDIGYHFMDTNNYEQTTLTKEQVGNQANLLKEEQPVDILYHAEKEQPLSYELPAFITLEVTYTEPGVKGDTATNSLKPAVMETGAKVEVPIFVDLGDKIKIDTRTGEYVERIK